jgi:uncharacterized glyoxalase superfamily protein PhnB
MERLFPWGYDFQNSKMSVGPDLPAPGVIPIQFQKLTPNLMVENVADTLDYYLAVLGFEFVMSVPSNTRQVKMSYLPGEELDFGMVKKDDVELMFQSRGSLTEEQHEFKTLSMGGSFSLYIEMEDLEQYVGRIRNRVKEVSELDTKFYGMREFSIRDCNGYLLTFAQKD